MFERLTKENVPELLDYFEKDPKNCLYSYIDLKKYGLDNPNLEIFTDRSENGELICAVTHYYRGVNVYSFGCALDTKATAEVIAGIHPDMINAPLEVVEALEAPLSALGMTGHKEVGYVTDLPKERFEEYLKLHNAQSAEAVFASYDASRMQYDLKVERAGREDLLEVAALICTDEGVGGTYTPEGLCGQLTTRMDDRFGRNYVVRKDGKIICHAGTYAEVPGMAVISGVITDSAYRGQKLAERVVSKLSEDLIREGMTPGLFYYTVGAIKLYGRLRFRDGSPWAKLVF